MKPCKHNWIEIADEILSDDWMEDLAFWTSSITLGILLGHLINDLLW